MRRLSFKHLSFVLATSALLTLSACGEGGPGSVSNVDTSEISPELLALTTTYEGKTYNYVGLMSFFTCASEKSLLPPIKTLATDARNSLEKAFAGGNRSNARSALDIQAKRANPSTPLPDPGLASCSLKTVDEISVTPDSSASASPGTRNTTSNRSDVSSDSGLRVEAETGSKTAGTTAYPQVEARGAGTQIMMFSGGDAGGQLSLPLPTLNGRYQVKLHWLNSGDSPAMAIAGAGLNITLPAASTENSNGSLVTRDLGAHTLSSNSGDLLTFTVLGNVTGQGNAWIGVDYISFTAL